MGIAPDVRSFEFSGYRLDAAQRRLLGPDGVPLQLPSRAFDVLLVMVERPGELLDKSTILKAVWPTTVVEESNLSQCIFVLRKAFGETAGENRFIVNVPGRGYQFVAQVTPVDSNAVEQAAPPPATVDPSPPPLSSEPTPPMPRVVRRKSIALGLVATIALVLAASAAYLLSLRAPHAESVTASHPPSNEPLDTIAVLPFADLSPGKDMEYFGDGLAEEIMGSLAKAGHLRVAGRTSAFSFKGKNEDVRAIGAALKVANILEGSVRRDGDRLRISVQLSRATDGFSLWSETFDRKLDDVLDIQGAIAREVVTALHPVIGSKATEPVEAELTRNGEAYRAYLRGIYLFKSYNSADLPTACEEFGHAVRLDPQFALAHASLARCYEQLGANNGGDVTRLRSLAYASVDRALKLDPRIADYWWMQWFSGREVTPFVDRVERTERSLAANPNDTDAVIWLGRNYLMLGRSDDAYRMFERAYLADPLWPFGIEVYARMTYEWRGDRQRVMALADDVEHLAPADPAANDLRARLAFDEGRALDWDRAVTREVELAPRALPVQGLLSLDYSNLGLIDAALHHAKLCQQIDPKSAAGWYNVAHIHLFSGNVVAARAVVQETAKLHPTDSLSRRARAELQYMEGDCGAAVESIVLSQPALGQPPAALDVFNEIDSAPMLDWCLRKQGNNARAAEIEHAFEIQFAAFAVPASIAGTRARMSAAMGDRRALIAHLQELANTKSMRFAFSPHEPMIQPYLADPEVKRLLNVLEARRAEWRRILPVSSVRVPVPGITATAAGS